MRVFLFMSIDLRGSFSNLNISYNKKEELKTNLVKALSDYGFIDSKEEKSILSKVSNNADRKSITEIIKQLNSDSKEKLQEKMKLNLDRINEFKKEILPSLVTINKTSKKIEPIKKENENLAKDFVQDELKNDDIIYVGLNSNDLKTSESQSGKELNTLNRANQNIKIYDIQGLNKDNIVNIDGVKYDLKNNADIYKFAKSLKLPPNKEKQIAENLILYKNPENKNEKPNDITEMAKFINLLNKADKGKIEMPTRLILSGHNQSQYIYGTNKGYESDFSINLLNEIKDVFPKQLAKVEDIMLSACNSGWETDVSLYRNIFPNIKSGVSYTNTSPSGSEAKNDIKSFENKTRGISKVERIDFKNSPNISTFSSKNHQIRNLDKIPDIETKLEFISEVTASLGIKGGGKDKNGEIAGNAMLDFERVTGEAHIYKKNNDGKYIPKWFFIEEVGSFHNDRLGSFVRDKENIRIFIKELDNIKYIDQETKNIIKSSIKNLH